MMKISIYLFLLLAPQIHISSNRGFNDNPFSVNLYSTFGGIWGYSILSIKLSDSSSFKTKLSILLMCGGWGEEYFTPVIDKYNKMVDTLSWNDLGTLLIPNVLNKGDILKTDVLEKSKKLGESI